ncbi:TrmH family RNA methyltransferase [Flavobacteriaceae bacterium M23B6Z8]
MKEISSLQNPLVKQIISLQSKSRERKKSGLFVIEGLREIELAVSAGYLINTFLIDESKYTNTSLPIKPENFTTTNFVKVTEAVYKKIAYRESTEGILALSSCKEHDLNTLTIKKENPLFLVAEAPEKPGNIGALLRTADAAGLDAVIIANPKTDLYNPNIIRSSVGCIFTNSVYTGSTTEIIQYLKKNHISIYAAALEASSNYHLQDFTGAAAIVVGTEATGLGDDWLQNATQNIKIPMQGRIDSMNVSVAAAIIIFEACRQRNFK